MDCPVIAIRHEEDGKKCILAEVPPGDPESRVWRLSLLAATKLAKELTSSQSDGSWARIPVKW